MSHQEGRPRAGRFTLLPFFAAISSLAAVCTFILFARQLENQSKEPQLSLREIFFWTSNENRSLLKTKWPELKVEMIEMCPYC